MKSNRVMLRVEDFRAIGKAEIKLDGITVVAGVNGCGKSSLSKLLYWVYRVILEFDIWANNNKSENLDAAKNLIEIMVSNYISENMKNIDNIYSDAENKQIQKLELTAKFYELLGDWKMIKHDSSHEQILPFLNKFSKFIIENKELIKFQNKNSRIWTIFNDVFQHDENLIHILNSNSEENKELSFFIDVLILWINQVEQLRQMVVLTKDKNILEAQIKKVFHTENTPKTFDIIENKSKIISTDKDSMQLPYEVDNVIYIDTPMFFGHTEEEHWKDANEKLKQRPKLNEKPKPIQEIDDLIKRQIFGNGAEVKFDELSESFTFRTSSGVEMDLSDSATGMKTFAVLDRLVKNGSINKKTLLILDEPEAHLHPQWIVELGRLLTLINKHIGAKIFVATHSPDMVQALRYIPNKEGTGENVNFYLAEFNQENGLFDYRDLQGEIDDIFGSFNLSLDKLSNYGED